MLGGFCMEEKLNGRLHKLVFQNPFHVQVIIHEKTVVGYVSYMSSFMYFDKDGYILPVKITFEGVKPRRIK